MSAQGIPPCSGKLGHLPRMAKNESQGGAGSVQKREWRSEPSLEKLWAAKTAHAKHRIGHIILAG